MDTESKILLVFDLDNTILQQTTDYEVIKLLPPKELDQSYYNWANYMQSLYLTMKANSVKIEQIKKIVESIPLSEGFLEIFEFIRRNKAKFETIIVSGSNTLYIEWLLQFHRLEDVIDGYFSNFAEPNEDMLIQIKPNHVHNCPRCCHDLSQCKRKILEDYFRVKTTKNKEYAYSSIVYVGDGSNDFCPSTLLGANDLLFPREEYDLHHMISSDTNEQLRCQIHPWENGNKILDVIKDSFFCQEYKQL